VKKNSKNLKMTKQEIEITPVQQLKLKELQDIDPAMASLCVMAIAGGEIGFKAYIDLERQIANLCLLLAGCSGLLGGDIILDNELMSKIGEHQLNIQRHRAGYGRVTITGHDDKPVDVGHDLQRLRALSATTPKDCACCDEDAEPEGEVKH
jgi:hypothetical protein